MTMWGKFPPRSTGPEEERAARESLAGAGGRAFACTSEGVGLRPDMRSRATPPWGQGRGRGNILMKDGAPQQFCQNGRLNLTTRRSEEFEEEQTTAFYVREKGAMIRTGRSPNEERDL